MDTRIRGYAYDARLALHQPAFTYYAALSTCVYDIGMLLMMILPALKGKMAGFFTRLCAYDGPHLLTADYSISPSAIQHPSSSTPPIYVYTASQNLNDNADNCSFSQYDSNYDPSQCTTSASDVTMIYAYDANGNVTDLVGTNGEFLAQYQFDPYGNTISKTGTLADANPFRFSTKYLDAETGLYYYGHRFYNPEIGRWASRDPVSPKCNLYTGLLNNPVKYVDGDGRDESYWPPGQNDPPSKVPWPIPTPGPVPPTAPGVYKCCRDIEENSCLAKLGNACGFQHCFLKTSTKAAGMGPEGGTADVLPVCPCGSKTAVIDHAGESSKPGSKCSLIPLIDEDCVNKELDIGKSLGKWSLGNQCNSFVDNIITKCSKGGIFGGVTGGVVQ